METLHKIKIHKGLSGIVATLSTSEGIIEVHKCIHSGSVITRSKIDTLTGVFHPGIIMGEDIYGRLWVAHNHYENKKPMFDTLEKYLDGEEMIWDERRTAFLPDDIVERAVTEVHKGKTYNRINYNCQTFVNLVVRNEHISESVEKLSNGTLWFGLFLVLMGIIYKNNRLIIAGAATTGVAGVGKMYSRIEY